ncbi:hypothetical protein XENOCAPTIV_027794, partial [Xenoophorus captivus]
GPAGPKGDRGDPGPPGYGLKGEKGAPGLIIGPDGNPLYLGGLTGPKGNEVAEVQPPPVVVYPHTPDRTANNGAGHYSQSSVVIRPIEPPVAAADSSEPGVSISD